MKSKSVEQNAFSHENLNHVPVQKRNENLQVIHKRALLVFINTYIIIIFVVVKKFN